jgi:hypothetical protein
VRSLTSGIAVFVAAAAAASAWASPSAAPRPSCADIVVLGGQFTWRPTRVVLDAVVPPAAYVPQTVKVGGAWPYWSKAAMIVRAGNTRVVVSVPRAWRGRVAISWGSARASGEVVFPSCPVSSNLGDWNPYTGGFLLRSRTACVPLVFRVGERTQTVRFGVGKRCP